jgi:hypothetical protein
MILYIFGINRLNFPEGFSSRPLQLWSLVSALKGGFPVFPLPFPLKTALSEIKKTDP